MFFIDDDRQKKKIDFILTYTIADQERDKKHDDSDKRKKKREKFLANFKYYGLQYEIQYASVSDSR